MNQRPYGRDVHFWWWLTRLDRRSLDSRLAQWLERRAKSTKRRVLDSGVYQAALAAGRPAQQPMFARFTENGVASDNGLTEPVNTVIFATGYRPNLDYLESLGALDTDGRVLQQHGASPSVPGLYYVGLSNQRTYAWATLRGVGPDAAVVRDLKRHLATPPLKGWATGRKLLYGPHCCPARQSPA